MGKSLVIPDFQSYPLTMVAENFLDKNSSKLVKRLSSEIMEKTNQPLLIIDNQGNILLANNALYEMANFIKGHDHNIFNFHELNLKEKNLLKLLDFGIPISECGDNLIVNKCSIPVKVNIYPIFSSDKNRLGAVCLIKDITKDVSYNRLLKQSEIVLDTINTGVILLDKSLKINMVNKNIEEFLKISQYDIVGLPVNIFLDKLGYQDEYILQSLEKQINVKDYEISFELDNIKYFYICDTHILITDDNELDGVIIFLKNITKIKEIEMHLAKSDKLSVIGELAAGTAHEIRNPLTTVKGFVQLIHQKATKMGIEEFNNQIELILKEIDRVNYIITEFLNLAKPQGIKMEKIDFNVLLNEIMFLLENEALHKGITIEMDFHHPLPMVMGDKNQLTQVVLNIVNNAFQAISQKGLLKIKTSISIDDSQVIINFIDNGKGIPKDLLGKIFDPFVSDKEGGTGLGLAISNRIISDHKGEIKVSSKPGEGSKFSIILPIAKN
ncbi:MAG: ATP-binding protein [Bacillota bacterium]